MLNKWERNLFTHQGARLSADEIEEAYESPNPNKNKLLEKKRILENDLTKALINTIIYSDSAKNIFINILKDNGIEISKEDIKPENIELFTSKVDKRPEAFLLLIKSKYNRNIDEQEEKRERELDALLFTKKINIGIESKLTSKVNISQLEQEKELLNINKEDKDRLKEIYWETIHNAMQESLEKKENKNDVILKNFVEYLEVAGMTEFAGIPFALNNGQPEENYSEDKAKDILLKIKKELQETKKFKDLIFNKKQNWTTIYEKDKWELIQKRDGKKIQKIPHYSIYVFPEYFGMDLYLQDIPNKNNKIIKITDSLEEIYEKIIKKYKDQTWVLELGNFRGFLAKKYVVGKFFNSRDNNRYEFQLLRFFLHEEEKNDTKKKIEVLKNFVNNLKFKFLKIERRFYYNNPYYSKPYAKKKAEGNDFCKSNMNSKDFINVIIETLEKLREISEELKI